MDRNQDYVYLLYSEKKTDVSKKEQFLGVFDWESPAIKYLESRGETLSKKDESELKFYKRTFSREINFRLDVQVINPIIETVKEQEDE